MTVESVGPCKDYIVQNGDPTALAVRFTSTTTGTVLHVVLPPGGEARLVVGNDLVRIALDRPEGYHDGPGLVVVPDVRSEPG